jgi:hypothetical protein
MNARAWKLGVASTAAIVAGAAWWLGCSSSNGSTATQDGGVSAESGSPAPSLRRPIEAGSTTTIEFGEAGAPTSCAARPQVSPDLVRACILRTSCISEQPPFPISTCLSDNALAHDTMDPACVTAAQDCAHLAPCVTNGQFTGSCPYGDYGGHCYGTVYVDCNSSTPAWTDCAQEGKVCLGDNTSSSPTASTGCGYFTIPNSTYCTQGFTSGCLLGDAAICYNGTLYYYDCAGIGQGCVDDPVNGASCVPLTPSCDGGAPTCSPQGAAVSCSSLGQLQSFDCAAAGLSCVIGGGTAACVAAGCSQQDVTNCTETCDGPYLNTCVGGGRVVIDCRSYGFTTCREYTSQASQYGGKDYATCAIF